LVGVFGIITSFFFSNGLQKPLFWTSWIVYLFIAALALSAAIFRPIWFERRVFQYSLIIIDFLVVATFLLLIQNVHSELYLMLLLPLVVSAHFLPRWIAVGFTGLTILVYGGTIFFSPQITTQFPFHQLLLIWLFRALFLSLASWLYRIQRSIPRYKATRIISPSTARDDLEELLERLKVLIDYDTASLQLLYHDRLFIVACVGFPNKSHIYSIEFPTNNPRYPNSKVLKTGIYAIENADDFPSFRDHIYHATHIKTWMGIPLVSPSTGEVIGLLSIDSMKESAYTKQDALYASRIALKAVAFLTETTLGPAALTMLTMRESVKTSLQHWSNDLAQRAVTCKDDLEAAAQIVKIGKQVFRTEDCSLYLLRPKYKGDISTPHPVLHLVASSSIPSAQFIQHESVVSDEPHCGLTGYAVHKNVTLNLNAFEIEQSPFHGTFTGNLIYLESKRSKQVMIVPIRSFLREPIGALKIENKVGWPSDNRFTSHDQYLFESFTHTIGTLIEGIRQRNYINRQRANIHRLRGMISEALLKPLDSLLKKQTAKRNITSQEYLWIRQGIGYVASEIDNLLLDPGESLILESGGLIPALLDFVSLLSSGFPHFRDASAKVFLQLPGIRDDLPYLVRETFFDIGREALLNAIRHSKVEQRDTGRITICFRKPQGAYELIVHDNGIGFQMDEKERGISSYGLREMKKAIQNIERIGTTANLSIESTPGKGTSIKITWTP
jgi:hypothetical protein